MLVHTITYSLLMSTLLQNSKALSVDDRRPRLFVLLLRDPHVLKGAQGGEDRASDPHGVLPLGRRYDFDAHGGWCKRRELPGCSNGMLKFSARETDETHAYEKNA